MHSRMTGRQAAWIALVCLWTGLAQAQSPESDWPRQTDTAGWTVVLYQPQVESFKGDVLEARAAVSVRRPGSNGPQFGAVWLKARVSTDYDERKVSLVDVSVTDSKFPDLSPEQVKQLSGFLETEIPTWKLVLDLDLLIAGLDGAEVQAGSTDELNHKPPKIYFRKSPTVLVITDGEPILREIEGSKLKYVVNTPYFMVKDVAAGTYYLKGGAFWYSSADVATGWKYITAVPESVLDVAKKAEAASPADSVARPDSSVPEITTPPAVLVSTEPAELLLSDGEPNFASVEGTGLLYLKNSENDILMDIQTQQYYVLLAGRWYRSKSLESGPWQHVAPDQVPADFARIPAGSDMADVLPSVNGTQEARDAVLEATIPQTAEVDKSKTISVEYDGEPKFDPIKGTDMKYAVNTSKSVLLIDGKYYCCDDAVWYVSDQAKGPWRVAESVPSDVEDIPASSPVYNVKYVYIYETTPQVVYVGYTPAYTGVYYYGGCMVYGTGYWYYPPYPAYYYPRPVTYGFGVHYNPWTGWGCSFGVSYGWLTVSVHSGGYYGGYWGPAGYHNGYRHGYAHGYYNGRRQGFAAGYRAGQHAGGATPYNRNMYRNQQGTRTAQPGAQSRPAAQPAGAARPSTANKDGTGGQATAARTPKAAGTPNNVYTDKNGNVYRNEGGQWQQRDNTKGSWNAPATGTSAASNRAATSGKSAATAQDLNRSQQSRQHGAQRSQSYKGGRSGGASRGGGHR